MRTPDAEKAAFRTSARNRRLAISEARRIEASADACAHILAAPWWPSRRCIALYAAYGSELDPIALEVAALQAGMQVCYPRVHRDSLQFVTATRATLTIGYAGIQEPEGSETLIDQIDLIIVPGLAFDLAGRRMGSGRGFYDRYLAKTSPSLGFAYEEQIVVQVPTGVYDRKMAGVVTDQSFVLEPDFK